MTFNELPTTSIPTAQSDGMEPKIIRATFKPSSEFDNYVEVTPPKVLPRKYNIYDLLSHLLSSISNTLL